MTFIYGRITKQILARTTERIVFVYFFFLFALSVKAFYLRIICRITADVNNGV